MYTSVQCLHMLVPLKNMAASLRTMETSDLLGSIVFQYVMDESFVVIYPCIRTQSVGTLVLSTFGTSIRY